MTPSASAAATSIHESTFGPDDVLSIVVISYENKRELPRTLFSLSPRFQVGVSADQYEVILVDNGSKRPPRAKQFADLGLDLSVIVMEDPTHSPVAAINRGLDASIGAAVTVFIDGARLASPGLVQGLREALAIDPRAVVGARGRYLGPVTQRVGMRYGYDQKVEDRMLDRIDWKNNGYRLFEGSIFDEPSGPTWLHQVGESNCITMRRHLWAELGGFDPAFSSKGGGYVNLDTWRRACLLPDTRSVLLLGEATFHQFHGGVATNSPRKEVQELHAEYRHLRGGPYRRPPVVPTLHGQFHHQVPPHELAWVDGTNFIDLVDPDGPMAGMLPELRAARAAATASTRTSLTRRARRRVRPVLRRGYRRLRRSRAARSVARVLPAGVRRRVVGAARRAAR